MLTTAFTADAVPVSETEFQAHALNITHNVVIQACAGSGKTWLLTARLLRLLLAGTPPQAILAITFTRKATQEMKQRLADMLAVLCNTDHEARASTLSALGLVDTPTLRAQLAQCWEQAFSAGQWPTIATFHEWFSSVRKAAPFSLQTAPAAVLTEDEFSYKQRAWRSFWKISQQDASVAAHRGVAIAELSLNGFETALNAVFERRAEWQIFLENGGANLSVAQAQAAFEAFIQLKSAAHIDCECRLLAQSLRSYPKLYLATPGLEMNKRGLAIAAALEHFSAYEASYPLDADLTVGFELQLGAEQALALRRVAIGLLASLSIAKFALPAAGRIVFSPMKPALNLLDGGVDGFQAAYSNCHAALSDSYAALESLRLLPAHHGVLYCANALITAYQQEKLAHGVVDFTDLELEALSVLRATQGALNAGDLPWTRVQHVLLDEFQDTNPIQWQALQAFLTPMLSEAKSGGQAASVFMVGDPKQSIYRFRRADPALFGHVAQWLHIQFGAVVLRTQRTRRNAAGINALVNGVFVTPELADEIFAEQFTLSDALGEVRLLPVIAKAGVASDESEDPSGQSAEVRSDLLTQALDAQFGAASANAAEAEQIAQQLLDWKIHHADLPWAQVMVLARRRVPLKAMAAALHAVGIPCVNDEKGGFFQQPEVADVLALLKALHSPADALSTLQALRSPIFAISNMQLNALLAHWQANRERGASAWCGLGTLEADWARNALSWLKQWQWLARHLPTHDALDAMFTQGQIEAKFCAAAPAQRAPWIAANLKQLLRTALDVDGGRYPSLAKFIASVQALSESNTVAAEPMSAPDAVRLSTIHSAKGLEAHCVVLMDTCSPIKSDGAIQALLDWPATQAAPSYFGVTLGPAWAGQSAQQAQAKSQAAGALERHTLLYVAITRAKNALWISGTQGKGKNTVYSKVEAALSALDRLDPEFAVVQAPRELVRAELARPSLCENSALLLPPAVRSTHSLLNQPPSITPPAPPYLEPQATQRGKALHAALQAFMQYGVLPGPLALLTRGTLPLSEVNAVLNDAATMVQRLQLATLRTHASVLRFAIEQAWMNAPSAEFDRVQSGSLRPDLVAYGNDFCWLIDYKTHFNPGHAAAADYAAQLRRYLALLPPYAQAYLLTSEGQCWAFEPSSAQAVWRSVQAPWI